MPRGRKKGSKPAAKRRKKDEEKKEEEEKKTEEEDPDFMMEEVFGDTDVESGDSQACQHTRDEEEDEDDEDPLAALRRMAAERDREEAQAQAQAQAKAQAQARAGEANADAEAEDADARTVQEVEDLCSAQARRRLAEERAGAYRAFFQSMASDARSGASVGVPALLGDARSGAAWADVLAAGFPVDRALGHTRGTRAAVEAWLVEAAVAPAPPAAAHGAVAELTHRLRTHGTLAAPLAPAVAAVLAALRSLGGGVACDASLPVRSEVLAAATAAEVAAEVATTEASVCLSGSVPAPVSAARRGTSAAAARASRVAAVAAVVALLAKSAHAAAPQDVVPLFADVSQYLELVNSAVGLAADLQERYDDCNSDCNYESSSFDIEGSISNEIERTDDGRLAARSGVTAALRDALTALVDGAGSGVDDSTLVGVVLGRASLPNAYARTQTLAGRAGGRACAVRRAAVWAVLHHCAAPGSAELAVTHARAPAPTALSRTALLAFLADDAAAPHFGRDRDFGVVWRCLQDCVLACGFVGGSGDTGTRDELERLVRLLEGFSCTYSAPAIRDQYEADADDFVDWLRTMLSSPF